MPVLQETMDVIRVKRGSPAPSLRLFRVHARVVKPTLIQEIDITVGEGGKSRRWNCVDGGTKCLFVRANCIFRPLPFLDIDVLSVSLNNIARLIFHGHCTEKKPPIDAIETPESRLIFSGCL